MATLADPPDLTVWMQRSISSPLAVLLLDIASGKIRDECGWSITQETGVVRKFTGDGSGTIWLPTKNLTAVASVVENGTTLTVDVDYYFKSDGRIIRIDRAWQMWPVNNIVVTYTHGYTTVPSTVKGICVALAGRLADNPEGLRQYSVGGVSATIAGEAADIGPNLSGAEIDELGPYRLDGIA